MNVTELVKELRDTRFEIDPNTREEIATLIESQAKEIRRIHTEHPRRVIEAKIHLEDEIKTLKSQNERLVKALEKLLVLHEQRLVMPINHAYFEQVNASADEAKALLAETMK